jgi:two-component system, sensor histidine kinase PdtaS
VINELLTNSWKYAFSKGDEGTVQVTLRLEGEERLFLSVSDNGPGLGGEKPEAGFGLTIVEGYARQFGGELEFSTQGGFTVSTIIELEQ